MMLYKTRLPLILILLVVCCTDNTVKNSTVKTECPQKIASLSLASDEILLEIIQDGRVIGVTYLADNEKLSNVFGKTGDVPHRLRPNLEQILEIKPDIVIVADYVDFSFVSQIEKSGINTHFLEGLDSIESIRTNINSLGTAVCEKEKADALISAMDERIAVVKNRDLNYRPRVLYLFPSYFTAGINTTINDLIGLSGGVNIGSTAGIVGNKKISREYILNSDPDIIIIGSFSPEEENFIDVIRSDKVLSNLKAVRSGEIYTIETKNLTTVSHNIVNGIEQLAEIIDSYNKKTDEDKTKTGR